MKSNAKKICFIGAGNMGGAILCALAENNYPAESLFFYETDIERANKIAEISKAQKISSLSDCFSGADIIFLCLKPQIFSENSSSFSSSLSASGKKPIVVSIMAGVKIGYLSKIFPKCSIVRTMPNIAVTVKKGTVAIASDGIEEEILQTVEFLFSKCAHTVRVLESQMDAVTGLSGSGPAFVFQFIEALAMGGIKMGLQKEAAMKLALSTIGGSVEMLEKLKLSPGELTANVCSPAGTTIAGIQELENKAFKGIVMSAVETAAKRSAELGKD